MEKFYTGNYRKNIGEYVSRYEPRVSLAMGKHGDEFYSKKQKTHVTIREDNIGLLIEALKNPRNSNNSLGKPKLSGKVSLTINFITDEVIELMIGREEIIELDFYFINNDYSQEILLTMLESLPKLEKLILPMNFNLPLDDLPSSLLYLEIGPVFNHSIDNFEIKLTNLNSLIIRNTFIINFSLKKLPQSLKKLHIIDVFDDSIDYLPDGLEELIMNSYNKEIKNLPKSLKIINFGTKYNQPLPELPSELEEIKFGLLFNQPIDKLKELLKLKKLIMKNNIAFNHDIDDLLPKSLQTLVLGNIFNKPLNNLDKLTNLKTLELGNKFNQKIKTFPDSLESLVLGHDFNQKINNLPCGLKHLVLGYNFEEEFPKFNCKTNSNIKLTPKLENLIVLGKPNQFHLYYLPKELEYLELSNEFNQSIDDLPNSLKILRIGTNFDKKITKLPESLEVLIIKAPLPKSKLKLKEIPKNLKTIRIGGNVKDKL